MDCLLLAGDSEAESSIAMEATALPLALRLRWGLEGGDSTASGSWSSSGSLSFVTRPLVARLASAGDSAGEAAGPRDDRLGMVVKNQQLLNKVKENQNDTNYIS